MISFETFMFGFMYLWLFKYKDATFGNMTKEGVWTMKGKVLTYLKQESETSGVSAFYILLVIIHAKDLAQPYQPKHMTRYSRWKRFTKDYIYVAA